MKNLRRAVIERLRAALSTVERYARDARLGAEPDPYVAVLVADGDKMGAAISSLASPDAISRSCPKPMPAARVLEAVRHRGQDAAPREPTSSRNLPFETEALTN